MIRWFNVYVLNINVLDAFSCKKRRLSLKMDKSKEINDKQTVDMYYDASVVEMDTECGAIRKPNTIIETIIIQTSGINVDRNAKQTEPEVVNDEIAAIQKYISELVASATGTESTVEDSDSMSCDFDHDIEDSISELETVKHELNDFKIRCGKHANKNLKQYVENLGTAGQTTYVEETLKQCYYISNNNITECKRMMEQLELETFVKVTPVQIPTSNKISNDKSSCKNKKIKCESDWEELNKRISKKIIDLFGVDYFESDKKLMQNTISTLNKTKLYCDKFSETDISEDDDKSSCPVKKVYTVHSSKDRMKIKINSHVKSSTKQNSLVSCTKKSSKLRYDSSDNIIYTPIEFDNNIREMINPTTLNNESTRKNIQDAETSDGSINNVKDVSIECDNNVTTKINANYGVLENVDVPTATNKISDTQNRLKREKILSDLRERIGLIINIDDQIYKDVKIEDLAVHFCNTSSLSKYTWESLEFKKIKELVLKLAENFNNTKYNIAKLSYCLVCIFHKIANKSLNPPNEMKLKFIKFIHIIEKIICYYDEVTWKKWFSSKMFLEWCFVLVSIFIPLESDIQLSIFNNKSIIENAMGYFNMIKDSKYVFTNKYKAAKRGIFEFTRSDDILEIDNMTNARAMSKNNTIEPKSKRPKLGNQSKSNKIKNTNVDKKMAQLTPKITIRAAFSFKNSFKKKMIVYKEDDKSLDRIQPNSDTNKVQENNLNTEQSLRGMMDSIANIGTRSVNANEINTNMNISNVNEQGISLPQEISTVRSNRTEIITNRNLSKYYNNISANSSTQPPSYMQAVGSLLRNTQPHMTGQIASNNIPQINTYNPLYHSNNNNVMNTAYNESYPCDLPNTFFEHSETTNISSQVVSSRPISSECRNQLCPENVNLQLPPISTISTSASSRLNSINTAFPSVNNFFYPNCNLCANVPALNRVSTITASTMHFQPTIYNSQVSPDLPDAQIPNMPTQLYPANKRLT